MEIPPRQRKAQAGGEALSFGGAMMSPQDHVGCQSIVREVGQLFDTPAGTRIQ